MEILKIFLGGLLHRNKGLPIYKHTCRQEQAATIHSIKKTHISRFSNINRRKQAQADNQYSHASGFKCYEQLGRQQIQPCEKAQTCRSSPSTISYQRIHTQTIATCKVKFHQHKYASCFEERISSVS
jgi:hypothetical protein